MMDAAGCTDLDRVLYSLAKVVAHGEASSDVTSCFR